MEIAFCSRCRDLQRVFETDEGIIGYCLQGHRTVNGVLDG